MGKCETEGSKRWESTVNGNVDDGTIFIQKEVAGEFNGKHEKSKHDLRGRCLERGDGIHKIRFTVPDNGHLYVGTFMGDNTIEGLRIKLGDICTGVDDAPPFDGGDED